MDAFLKTGKLSNQPKGTEQRAQNKNLNDEKRRMLQPWVEK